jgi:hypothetical protein
MVRAKQQQQQRALSETEEDREEDKEKSKLKILSRRKSLLPVSKNNNNSSPKLSKSLTTVINSNNINNTKNNNFISNKLVDNEELEENNNKNNKKTVESEEFDLEYMKLQAGNQTLKRRNVCYECEFDDDYSSVNGSQILIDCQGPCQNSFHLDCVGLLNCDLTQLNNFKCDECSSNLHSCFICKKRPEKANKTRRCSLSSCGKYYHEECINKNSNDSLFRKENQTTFICPLHWCLTCYSQAMVGDSSIKDTLLIHATKGIKKILNLIF